MRNNRHIIDYLRSHRRGRKANRVEREAMQDPFLSEALEGYDKHAGNHADDILRLQQAITLSTRRHKHTLRWAVAACIIALLGLSTFLFLQSPTQQVQHAPEVVILPDTVKVNVADSTGNITPVRIAAKKEVQQPPPPPTENVSDTINKITPVLIAAIEEDQAPSLPTVEAINVDETEVIAEPMPPAPTQYPIRTTKPQQLVIKGKIIDDRNMPMPGVSVTVEGSNNAVVADINGNFSINIHSMDDKLQASFMGMETIIFAPDTSTTMLIALQESKVTLDEVLIVGYGNSKSEKLSSARLKTGRPEIGRRAYLKYIKENLRYPTDSTCNNISGRVVLKFRIDNSGRPYDIEITRSLCESLDEEAIRLIEEGSNWKYNNNDPVEYSIRFRKRRN